MLEIFCSVSAATPSLCVTEDFKETVELFYHPAPSGTNIKRDLNFSPWKKKNNNKNTGFECDALNQRKCPQADH